MFASMDKRRVTELTADELNSLAQEAWRAAAIEAFAKGLPITGSNDALRLRYHPDGQFEVLGAVANSSESVSQTVHNKETEKEGRPEIVRTTNRFQRALEQLETGIAMFDANRRLRFYNRAFCLLWNLDADFLDQEPSISDLIEQLHIEHKLPADKDARDFELQLEDAYGAAEAKERTWNLPDGRTIHITAAPDRDGATYFFHNATRRSDLEQRYDLLNRILRETLDNLTDAVAVFASDGRLRLHNPAFVQMWRLPPEALAKRPHIETISTLCRPLHGDHAAWNALRKLVTAIGSRETIANRLDRRDGSVINYVAVPLPDDATLVTFHDITDSILVERALRERNESLEDADKIKIDFVHHVSYELRSPLTNIIGFVHLLRDPESGSLGPKQSEYLDYITVSTNTLLALINNILDLATIDAGRMQLNLGPVDIRATMAAAAEGVQDRVVSGGLTLDLKAPPNIGSFIADERRLRQILFNLLANAVSFSPAGGTITLQAERRPDTIVFSVHDSGPGIPPDVMEKVFDWFETHSLGTGHRGTGIGLSLVRSFVESHGGVVTIDSVVGGGTTVRCVFPVGGPAEESVDEAVAISDEKASQRSVA
jgi:signal transduction histidine kinase